MRGLLQPGQFVRLDARPDWGLGQVQSVEPGRITVNFQHAGKVLLRGTGDVLTVVAEADAPPAPDAGPDTAPDTAPGSSAPPGGPGG